MILFVSIIAHSNAKIIVIIYEFSARCKHINKNTYHVNGKICLHYEMLIANRIYPGIFSTCTILVVFYAVLVICFRVLFIL